MAGELIKVLLEEAWARIASDPVVVDGLGILCAAREALTLDELGTVAEWTSDAQGQAFVHGARELLVETRRADAGPEYRLHHDSLRAHLAEVLGATALRAHHGALARRLATWPAPAEPTARRYALRHGLLHRVEAGDWAETWRLAADTSFLEAQCRELGVHEAEADVARAAERCRACGDEALCRRFDDLTRALRRESHWLRAVPEATPALLWNRLRRFGWSAAEIDRHLQISAEATFLYVRHVASRESPVLVRDLVGHADKVHACAITADGGRIISASADGTLKVWDTASGRELATLEGHAGWVLECAVTPDGRRVVSVQVDRTLKLWDTASGRELATLEGHAEWIRACAITADGARVVSASDDRTLKLWDATTARPLTTLEGHSGMVTACAMTPNGGRVVSGSADRTLKVWDTATGRVLVTLVGHSEMVTACAVTVDGARVVSASSDRTLKVWDTATGRVLVTLVGHADSVDACAMTADGARVISGSSDRTLKVWDTATGRELATLAGHAASVRACAVTADGKHVVSVAEDGTLKIWDTATQHPLGPDGHAGAVHACAVTAAHGRVISASADGTLKVWETATGRVLATLTGHLDSVLACAVTADGRRVVSVSADQTLKVWDTSTGRVLATQADPVGSVLECRVAADGGRVVSASSSHTLEVWDTATGRVLAALAHTDWVHACAMTADGGRVVSASEDGTLKVWDTATARVLVTLEGHSDSVYACAVTADGGRVVSASKDGTLKVWDTATARVLATLEDHSGYVLACALTPDGRRVVAASTDGTLRVWDTETCAQLYTHRGDTAFRAVAATANVIVAGDDSGSVWFLDWPPWSHHGTAHPIDHGYESTRGADPDNESPPPPTPEPAPASIRIERPRHGDLLIGPSIVSGTGPAHVAIFVHFRDSDGNQYLTAAAEARADSDGRWETVAFPHTPPLFGRSAAPGPYEIYATTVKHQLASQAITVFYRDAARAREVVRTARSRHRLVELCYELQTACIEATKLERGRCLLSRSIVAPTEDLEATAIAAGEQIAGHLHQLLVRQPLDVHVSIDADRHVSFEPRTAWGLYYGLPAGNASLRPSSNVSELQDLRTTSLAWDLIPHVSQIPEAPLRPEQQEQQVTRAYLEVRHDGYRPALVELEKAPPWACRVRLSPVLQKWIAVLDFPCTEPQRNVPGLSQVIARSMVVAIERRPELAPFAYFGELPTDDGLGDFLERLGRPPIEFGNQVLTLDDVQAMQSELESIDTSMISGEERRLRRKATDIQYLVRGSYRFLDDSQA